MIVYISYLKRFNIAAIQALKRKKRYEKQLQQIDGTLSTIEMQREALESANTNTQVLTTMKNAADALKAAHKNMDVDQVHDMMDDIAEQQDVAKEISDAISNPVAFGALLPQFPNSRNNVKSSCTNFRHVLSAGTDVDDEELERELEELEQEELDKELLGVGPSAAGELPEVPSDELQDKTKAKAKKPVAVAAGDLPDEDDEDYKQMLAWAN